MKNIILILCISFTSSLLAQEVQTFTLKELPSKPVNELLTRSMISGQEATIGYFVYKKGAIVPTHQHMNEQYSLITQGSVKVKILDKEYTLKAGQGIIIPPNVPHSFMALEDNTIDIDFFSPARKDWIDGNDKYFK